MIYEKRTSEHTNYDQLARIRQYRDADLRSPYSWEGNDAPKLSSWDRWWKRHEHVAVVLEWLFTLACGVLLGIALRG